MSANQNIVELQRDRDRTEPLSDELEQAAGLIRDRINRTAYDVGNDLQSAKAQCKHGQWLLFLDAAGIGERTARRMMQYARLITDDWDIDTEKALPPVSAVLGKTANLTVLINDEVDEKLQDEAESRATGWQKQADQHPEPEPRKATEPEPVPLEGEIIRPSSSKDIIAAQDKLINELTAKLAAADERIAIWIEGADEPTVIKHAMQTISTLRSQLANRIEDVRRLEVQIRMLKRERKNDRE